VSIRRISPVDIHVGRRVRLARLAAGMSQDTLAAGTGVTFQQIQKYEKGANRIGTGRLHAIAKILGVPFAHFFEGMEEAPGRKPQLSTIDTITEALSTKEGVRIAQALARIGDATLRRRIAELLEAVIESQKERIRAAR